MNANPKFLAATAHVDEPRSTPLPNSRKVYVRARAPISACRCAKSRSPTRPPRSAPRRIPPIFVYDTSGPYTDPRVQDRYPLGPARRCAQRWIEERDDTEVLAGPTSRMAASGSPIRSSRSCASI